MMADDRGRELDMAALEAVQVTQSLIKRLRTSAAAFREHPVYSQDGDPVFLHVQAAELGEAADALALSAPQPVGEDADLVRRLLAPAYWMSGSSEGHEGENAAPRAAAARITALLAENERVAEALREITMQAESEYLSHVGYRLQAAEIARAALPLQTQTGEE